MLASPDVGCEIWDMRWEILDRTSQIAYPISIDVYLWKHRGKSEAPRASARGICVKAKRNCAEANPPSLYELRRGRLPPFLPVLPHGASWRRRVNKRLAYFGTTM